MVGEVNIQCSFLINKNFNSCDVQTYHKNISIPYKYYMEMDKIDMKMAAEKYVCKRELASYPPSLVACFKYDMEYNRPIWELK